MRTAVFTIGSRNYFAFIKTLMQSLADTNPEWDRFVGVADSLELLKEEGYKLIGIDEIALPHPKQMEFRYTIMEFNTAIKPFVFKTLFTKYGYDRVIYLDPDIYVYEKMEELEAAFDGGSSIVLTPHLTGLWDDDKLPNEKSILMAGTYNCGFLALAKSAESSEFLKWWCKKLEKECIVDINNGVFVDQKWVDLVPGLFDNVCILRHEGYNTAYWNLSHRKPLKKNGKFYFNNQPLRFFHFSGMDPTNIFNVSKHSNRFIIDDIGITGELFKNYAETVLSNDYTFYQSIPYAFSKYEGGEIILDEHRYLYRNEKRIQDKCGENPFEMQELFANNKEAFDTNPVLVRLNKFRNYFKIMNRWIQLRDAAASIEEYLVKNGYTQIAIYGMGELGMRLYETLLGSKKVKVVYGIDKLSKEKLSNFVIYNPNDNLPKADVVIVSATFDFYIIKKSLTEIVKCPIISLEDVIMEC